MSANFEELKFCVRYEDIEETSLTSLAMRNAYFLVVVQYDFVRLYLPALICF